MSLRSFCSLIVVVCVPSIATAETSVEDHLIGGRLAEGETALAARVEQFPDDQEALFGLGVVQFLRGVENLGQFLHRHGAVNRANQVPLLRLPVPPNAETQPTTYADCRSMLETLLADLTKAEATLARIDGDVKVPLRFGQIRLDLDGNGEATDAEALWRLYAALNRQVSRQEGFDEHAQQFRIAFDTGDVYWLRGYCHLLSAMTEVLLAHDGQRWFDHCGPLLFDKAVTPFPFLSRENHAGQQSFDFGRIADVITAIHLMDFEVIEPQRMAAAREHLLAMAALSGKSWDAIVAETDNDAEWLPNARQQSVVGVAVTEEMIDTWRHVMSELTALLEGKTRIPFWRKGNEGVNLKRVFTEPRRFDLVLWVQGTGAAPYLEPGDTVSPETWRNIQQVFRGEFIGFALWFN